MESTLDPFLQAIRQVWTFEWTCERPPCLLPEARETGAGRPPQKEHNMRTESEAA